MHTTTYTYYTRLVVLSTESTIQLTYHCCMFFSTNSFCFSPGNKKTINKLQNTHTHTHKYFPKKFPYFDNALFSKNLDGFPLVMKMCTNLLVVLFNRPKTSDGSWESPIWPSRLAPIFAERAPGACLGFLGSRSTHHYPKTIIMTYCTWPVCEQKITPVTPLWFLRPLKRKNVKSSFLLIFLLSDCAE